MATAADVLKAQTAQAPLETVVRTVQLDSQVVLKIMQHCDGAMPNIVTGQLLGLDVGSMLEVTDCFPFPVSARARACSGVFGASRSIAVHRDRPHPPPIAQQHTLTHVTHTLTHADTRSTI